MDPTIKTYAQTQAEYQNTFVATIPEGDAADPNGFFHGLTHALAQIDTGIDGRIQRAMMNGFRGTADPDAMAKIAGPEIGPPLPATTASMNVLLQGTLGEPFDAGVELLEPNSGVTVKTTSGGAFVQMQVTQFVGLLPIMMTLNACVVSAVSETPGAVGMLKNGTALQVTSNTPNVLSNASVYGGDATGGTDQEDPEAYRQRDLDWVQHKPAGGRDGDLAMLAKSLPGIVKAVDFPELDGLGTHAVAVCGANNEPVSADQLAAVSAAINGRDFRIVGIKNYYALNATPRSVDFALAVETVWSNIGSPKLVVAGSTQTVVNVSDASGIRSGMNIVIAGAGVGGVPFCATVLSVTGNAIALTNASACPIVPAAGAVVTGGCAAFNTLYQRILQMFYALDPGDALSPSMSVDQFTLAQITDVTILAPVATVRPVVSADVVEICTPGAILIVPMES